MTRPTKRQYCQPNNPPKRWTFFKYPYLRNSIFRHFSTKNEKSFYFMHRIELRELGLNGVLRAKRGRIVPDAWEDIACDTYKLGKSWKHRSKNPKQYHHQIHAMKNKETND